MTGCLQEAEQAKDGKGGVKVEYQYWIEGKDSAFTRCLEKELRQAGLRPYGADGAKSGPLDFFIAVLEPERCGGEDYEKLCTAYENTALALLRAVGERLPTMEGGKKRLCFVTRANSSINLAGSVKESTEAQEKAVEGSGWESMVLAACNMEIATLFNRLNPEGFTFRVFARRQSGGEEAAYAADSFLCDRSLEEESARHSDERRLVLRDWKETELPW